MPPFAEAIVFIFLLIACGYSAALAGILKKGTAEGIADFVFTIAVPLLLFRTLSTADLGELSPWGLWAAYFSAIAVTWIVSHLTVRRVFGRDARAGVVSGLSGAFSNLVLLGLPFMLGVYGHDGLALLSLIVSVHTPIMMATTIVLFEWASRADGVAMGSPRPSAIVAGFLRQLFSNPLIIGILAGRAMRITGLPVPHIVSRLVDALANVAGPVALFSMGMGMRRFSITGQVAAGATLSAIKLFLMPALALAVAWLIGLPPLTAKVAVAAASLPSGVNSWLIAEQFNTGQRMASTAMTIGTAVAIVTTGFWLYVAAQVFG
jgi:predicted permease